jgi:DNA end-binding protein Ku
MRSPRATIWSLPRRSWKRSRSTAPARSTSTNSCRGARSTNSICATPTTSYLDGDVGQEAFAVIREAIKKEGMVALGRVVFTSREHVIMLEARGKGLMGMTLRYPYEVRKEEDYFDELPDQKVSKDMLDLAKHIVDTKAGHFQPEKFEDHYEQALKDLLKRKQEGKPIERPKDHKPSNVVNLMDALRKSVEAEGGGGRKSARSTTAPRRAPKKAGRSSARQKKAG